MLLTITVAAIIVTRGLIHNTLSNLIPYLTFFYHKKSYFKRYSKFLLSLRLNRRMRRAGTFMFLQQKDMQRMIELENFSINHD